MGWLNLNISRMEHNFSMKQKILNLCLRWHILRSYCFVVEVTFEERNFRLDLFTRIILLIISRGFNFANWLPVDSSRGFIFANLCFINVLYISIFSWFVLRLVVCESRNSYSNFSIFQIALFGYNRLNSRLFDIL